jgi:hypothetical protein
MKEANKKGKTESRKKESGLKKRNVFGGIRFQSSWH